jgi:molybdate/tungstate transport system permease protein
MKPNTLSLVFTLIGGLVLLFILAPILHILVSSSFPQIFETIKEKEVRSSISLTLLISLTATMVFAIFSIPLAYVLARKNFVGKKIVLGIIDLPILIPHSAAGIALLGVISRESMIGKIGEHVGISFIGNPLGIAVAMAFVSVPFLLHSAIDGFVNVPEKYEKAAYTLGTSNWRTFRTISLPLARRSILTGMIMMFARGMSEFGAIIIIAYNPMVTPILIYERFNSFGLKYAQPVSAIFIVISLLFFLILRYLSKKNNHA